MAHFFTISLRRLAKDRFYTAISVLSLALGISGALVISLYLISELSYDHHHENHERIYRVTTVFSGLSIVNSGYEIGPLLAAANPQFENYVRIREAPEEVNEANNEPEDRHDKCDHFDRSLRVLHHNDTESNADDASEYHQPPVLRI